MEVSCTALRKVAAILLVIIFFFNLIGYKYVFSILQTRADARLESLIDNNEYDDALLIELRVQLEMPYQYRFTDFERHYGQISIDGQVYTYVKRKIEGDQLILKCIPNTSKTTLINIAADFTKANSNNSQGDLPMKSLVKHFSFDGEAAMAETNGILPEASAPVYTCYTADLSEAPVSRLYQPPRS